MATLFIRNTRGDILKLFPKGGVVAEIGVAKGDFSVEILKWMEPKKFTLIDPWEEQAKADYRTDSSNVHQHEFDRRYNDVLARFQAERASGVVEVKRAYSTVCASEFPYEHFDFVYIDGDHTYGAVLADLRTYYPRLGRDGFLAGHDFANHLLASYANFGVIDAVCDFVRESNASLLLITGGSFPTYVLGRPDNRLAEHIVSRAVLELAPTVLVDDLAEFRFSTHVIGVNRLNQPIILPRISPKR
jgi:hypothetical protein